MFHLDVKKRIAKASKGMLSMVTIIAAMASKADITIEVLNGSGTSSNLQKVVNQLNGAGYKVTRTGSTNTTAKTTIINKKNIKGKTPIQGGKLYPRKSMKVIFQQA